MQLEWNSSKFNKVMLVRFDENELGPNECSRVQSSFSELRLLRWSWLCNFSCAK